MSNQPIRKTQARMMERQRALKQAQWRDSIVHSLPYVIAAAVVLFIGIAVFLVINQTANGTPRFQVDREKIDLGDRIFNQPVRAVFTVKNVGDGTLKLETPHVAEVLEGC
jgi:L-lactate permease